MLCDNHHILQNMKFKSVLGVNVYRFRSLLENQRVQEQRVSKAPRKEQLVLGVKLLQLLGPLELRLETRLQIHVDRWRGSVRVSEGGKGLVSGLGGGEKMRLRTRRVEGGRGGVEGRRGAAGVPLRHNATGGKRGAVDLGGRSWRWGGEERVGADVRRRRRSGGQEGVLKVTLEAADAWKSSTAIPALVNPGNF